MPLKSLLVGADAHTREVLHGVLHELNMVMHECADFTAAAARLASESFDIVIADCSDKDSASWLFSGIRKSKQNKSTLVIALLQGESNVRPMFAAGCNFVLYKPISAERAIDSLRVARGLLKQEKRRAKRVRLHGKASISYAATQDVPAPLLDLSEDGVSIRSEKKLLPTCKVYFQFNLPGQVSLVRLSGDVVWQDDAGRVGLRFAHVPQTSRRVLNDWLKASMSGEKSGSVMSGNGSSQQPSETPAGGLGLLSVSAADRREKTRHACRLSADVYRAGTTIPNRCTLSDISTGGCYVETTAPFPPGTVLEILVRTHDLKLHIAGSVQTVHPAFGMGVAFMVKTPEHRKHVEQLIACAAQVGISV